VIKDKARSTDLRKASEKSMQAIVAADQPSEMVDQNEKVHIPESFDESDADNETLSDKLRRIDVYTEVG